MILMHAFLFIAGLTFLLIGADYLVAGSASLAKKMHLSNILVEIFLLLYASIGVFYFGWTASGVLIWFYVEILISTIFSKYIVSSFMQKNLRHWKTGKPLSINSIITQLVILAIPLVFLMVIERRKLDVLFLIQALAGFCIMFRKTWYYEFSFLNLENFYREEYERTRHKYDKMPCLFVIF